MDKKSILALEQALKEAQLLLENQKKNFENELRQRTKDLETSRDKYLAFYDGAPDMFLSVSVQGAIVLECNQTLVNRLGYVTKADIIGQSVFQFYHESSLNEVKEAFKEFADKGYVSHPELLLKHADGQKIPVSLNVNSIRNEQGEVLYSISCWRDISQQKALETENEIRRASEKQLKEGESLYRTILNSVTDGWWDWNLLTNEEYLSPSFKALFGYEDHEIENSVEGWQRIMVKEDLKKALDLYKDHLANGTPYTINVRYRHKDGSIRWVICRGQAVRDEQGQFCRMVGIHTDITALKQAENKLNKLAHLDPLTNLPNRTSFLMILNRSVAQATRSHCRFAVLYLDLNDFKLVNDAYGHKTGDKLLVTVGKKLRDMCRDEDYLARIGGDEFALVTSMLDEEPDLVRLAARLIESIGERVMLDNLEVSCSLSIGIAVFPDAGTTSVELLKNADIAMYRAKDSEHHKYQFYTQALNQLVSRRLEIERYLKRAIDRQELSLNYQPIVSLVDNSIKGFESLMRWNSKELGPVSPAEFIPIAESTGLIKPLTDWLLDTVCDRIQAWTKLYPKVSQMTFNLNFSAHQLLDDTFLDEVKAHLDKWQVPYHQLTIEITETAIIRHLDKVSELFSHFRESGIGIALDDFGTGYSSLISVRDLPITTIKIDKSFIQAMRPDSKQESIVKALINLGKDLDVKIVAEGVETKEQLSFISEAGGLYVQGYFFYKPLSSEKTAILLGGL